MALKKNRCAEGAAVRRAHSDEEYRTLSARELTQFRQLGTNVWIGAIRQNQIAKPVWLLPAFDFQDLGSGGSEKLGWRLNPSDPARAFFLTSSMIAIESKKQILVPDTS
jgi:hypothetical protein